MRRAALIATLVAAALAAPNAQAATSCRAASVDAVAGRAVALKLDCRTGAKWVARGRTTGVTRTIVAEPLHGTLSRLDARAGTVRYRPEAGYAGTDTVRFRVYRGGARHTGTIRLRVVKPAATPQTEASTNAPAPGEPEPTPLTPAPEAESPAPAAPFDPLPLASASIAFGTRNWVPTAQDTCPKALHDRYAVIGPDGKKYPTWHPPVVTNPATGQPCSFGHEHGRDPHGSDLYGWVSDHFATPGVEAWSGIPFGQATEALDAYAADHPGTPTRQEDHVGYKVDYENDVRLLSASGADVGVTCDYLVRVHQGSHSADATSNNVHELLYAVRCSDGTELISNTIARFGDAGQFSRSCDPAVHVTTTDNGYPDGPGAREIPDRGCLETTFLVPSGRTTSAWALYEKWSATNELRTAGGDTLAVFDSAFGVFNPSRYANVATPSRIGRSIDLCWEAEPNGDRANGNECPEATANGSIASAYAFDDARSPFNGTYRDVYLRESTVRNAGGPRLWYTDPYGGNASPTPFPGAICQLVGNVDNSALPDLQQRVFGRNRTNDAAGVHAPN